MPPNKEQQERLNFVVEADNEPLKNIEDVLADVEQRLFNPKPLKRTPFPESYVGGDVQIHVHLMLAVQGGSCETGNYCAVFEHLPIGGDVQERDEGVGGFGLRTHDGETLSSEMQFPVFVPVGKLAESGERVIVGSIRSF